MPDYKVKIYNNELNELNKNLSKFNEIKGDIAHNKWVRAKLKSIYNIKEKLPLNIN